MKNFALVIVASIALLISSTVTGSDVEQGDVLKIVTPDTVARLCPYPNCGSDQHLTRIPEGTELVIDGIQTVKSGMMSVTWFEVTYKDKRGWVSIYDTDQ